MSQDVEISVVILTCNQRDLTLRCLQSLSLLISRPDCEIIIVDNGSTDGTQDAVKSRCPEIRYQRFNTNRGVAAGRNTGLRLASGRNLMILDNDTVASADAILALSAILDNDRTIGLVAPKLVDADGAVQSSFRSFPGVIAKLGNLLRGKRASGLARTVPDSPVEPFYVIGAAQMFPREVYEATGGLDEKIFYGPEDADFCMAVRAQGRRVVYDPSVTIRHDWQRATSSARAGLSPAWRVHLKGLLYFWRKHRRFLY